MMDCSAVVAALGRNEVVVLTAPPGTGKTTRVPLALLEASWLAGQKILVLEPRRLAARRAAQYMADLLGEAVGETVGFSVRLERCVSKRTRIEFLTEGLLAQRLLSDPELEGVGCVLFDEFHERSLMSDFSFALMREVREALRPDCRVMLMSATVQENLLPEATFISIPAKAYPVEVRYLGRGISVEGAIRQALRECSGSVLCFLPGEGEIRRTAEGLIASGLPEDVTVAPLYAALPKGEQDRAVAPPRVGERKVVLATSIAESALTIEGIGVVVDSGLARVPRYSPRTGLSRLETRRISMDRVIQRTGRAGRLGPGVCYRLWEQREELTFVKAASPEILEVDLTQCLLMCAQWGSMQVPWLTEPLPSTKQRVLETLRRLGAIDAEHKITALGQAMVRFPVHPCLAAMMLRMKRIDPVGGALMAAVCAEGEKLAELRNRVDFRRVLEWVCREKPYEIWRLAGHWAGEKRMLPCLSTEALVPYLLYAFPDFVARRRDAAGERYLTAAGFGVTLPEHARGVFGEWLLAVRLRDGEGDAQLIWGVPLQAADLVLCTVESRICVEWDRAAGRIVAEERECIGAIVLKRRPLKTIPETARADAERCRLRQLGLPWTPQAQSLAQRIAFVQSALPEAGFPAVTEEALIEQLAALPGSSLEGALREVLTASGHSVRELDGLAPLQYEVPSGSKMRIHYEGDQPYIAVKIQEVFGLKSTPKLAQGRVPLLFHLLSPAQRPVQVTADLESFWANGYALVRKDLRGRYPKHYWPEDPTVALPSRRTLKPKQS